MVKRERRGEIESQKGLVRVGLSARYGLYLLGSRLRLATCYSVRFLHNDSGEIKFENMCHTKACACILSSFSLARLCSSSNGILSKDAAMGAALSSLAGCSSRDGWATTPSANRGVRIMEMRIFVCLCRYPA